MAADAESVQNAWREVDAGLRELTWEIAIGDPAEATYLTTMGRNTAARVIADLEDFFGQKWLHRAVHPAAGMRGPTLGPYFASLLGRHAFLAAVDLWARLQYLVETKTPGYLTLRKNLRGNPIATDFRHHISLARLAVIATQAGAQVELEPRKPVGGPGDLRAIRAGSDVFIELKVLWPDQTFHEYNQRVAAAQAHLRQLEREHDVYWEGDLPANLGADWNDTVANAAARAAADLVAIPVSHDEGTLTVRPGNAPNGTRISGPLWEKDQGRRLLNALRDKAEKTRSARAAWLWLEDAGALWPLSSFAAESSSQKIDTVQKAVEPILQSSQHVIGVVLTSGPERNTSLRTDAAHETDRGLATIRVLPDGTVREGVLVHRRLVVPGQCALVAELLKAEPHWLDTALRTLGVPGGRAALTHGPDRHDHRRQDQRHSSGLYLPAKDDHVV